MKKLSKKETAIKKIIANYEQLIKGIDKKAQDDKKRAYGGVVRAGKGELVEKNIAREAVLIAWDLLGEDLHRISFLNKRIKVPLRKSYVKKIKNPEVKKYILDNLDKCYYPQKTDLHVYIDNKFVMAIECKAYTENAMMKRILVDFTLLKEVYPNLCCVLFQLESQLGGDYSGLTDVTFGSFHTHTLLSYFNIDLRIITLLRGERKIDKPIHIQKYYKPITKESLYKAIQAFKELLEKYK